MLQQVRANHFEINGKMKNLEKNRIDKEESS